MMARRKSIHIEGFSHAAPIPAACRIGNLVVSGGIHGIDPATGQREAVNREWLAMFPEEHARPARHTMNADLVGVRPVAARPRPRNRAVFFLTSGLATRVVMAKCLEATGRLQWRQATLFRG
jgi:hypothetical protein